MNYYERIQKSIDYIESLVLHNEWLKQLKCPVIRIEGEQSTKERIDIAMSEIYNGVN